MNKRVAQLKGALSASVANYKGNKVPTTQDYILGNMGGHVAPSAVEVEPTTKSVGVTITNTDEVNDLYAPLFGSFEAYATPYNGVADFAGTAAGSAKGIVISPRKMTLAQFRTRFDLEPAVITSVNYTFGDATQLEKEWVIRTSDGNDLTQRSFFPDESDDLYSQRENKLTTRNFVEQISRNTTIFVKVAKAPSSSVSRSVSLAFFIGQVVDTANLGQGKTPIRVYQQSTLSNFGR